MRKKHIPLTSQSSDQATSLSSPINHQPLNNLLSAYLQNLRVRNCTESTIQNRRAYLHYFLRWCNKRDLFFLSQISQDTIQSYKTYVEGLKNQRTGEPLSINNWRLRLCVIKNFFTYLQKQDLIQQSPFLHVEIPSASQPLKRRPTLSTKEVDHVFSQVDLAQPLGLRDRAILETLYSTAIRRMELVALHIYDLDISEGLLRITHGKGQKERMVPIGKGAIYWIEKYLLQVRPHLIRGEDPGVLFLTCKGGGLSKGHLGNLVRGYLSMAELEHKGNCHLFRHTAVSLMLSGGADMLSLQEMLGHSSLETTAHYTQIGMEQLREAFKESHPCAFLKEGN